MRNVKLLLSLGAVLTCASVGCDRLGRNDDPRARAVLNQADQRADQLRSQANQVEHGARDQAHVQAEAMRTQADQVERQAREEADAIRAQDRARTEDQRVVTPRGTVTTPVVVPTATARGGGPAALQSAMQQYAEARCDREQRCDNVGVGKRYRDRSACLSDQVNDRSHDWEAADECRANGVNARELSECLSAARNDDCRNPFDDVTRASACRAGEVCGR